MGAGASGEEGKKGGGREGGGREGHVQGKKDGHMGARCALRGGRYARRRATGGGKKGDGMRNDKGTHVGEVKQGRKGWGSGGGEARAQTCDVLIFQHAVPGSPDPFPGTNFSS